MSNFNVDHIDAGHRHVPGHTAVTDSGVKSGNVALTPFSPAARSVVVYSSPPNPVLGTSVLEKNRDSSVPVEDLLPRFQNLVRRVPISTSSPRHQLSREITLSMVACLPPGPTTDLMVNVVIHNPFEALAETRSMNPEPETCHGNLREPHATRLTCGLGMRKACTVIA